MPRIAMLFAALCIAVAPIIAASNASAQDKPAAPDKADKTDKADKAGKPEPDKADKFDLEKILSGIKDMIDKQLKEDKPASTPPK